MEEPWRNSIVELVKDAPLSPYLFIFMMNVLFFWMLGARTMILIFERRSITCRKTVNNMKAQELLYADDTLVVAQNANTAKEYLSFLRKSQSIIT